MQSSAEQVPSPLPFSGFTQYKSIFDSKTFWGCVSTGVVAIAPAISGMVNEFLRTGKISPLTILKISMLLVTTSITIVGRIDADTPVSTPAGLPGPNRPESTEFKSIFDSKTFWGAVATALVAIVPAVTEIIDEFQKTGKINPASIFNISILLVTTGITILGRIDADTRVYTPASLPGPNKPAS
ncbi:hypothetical protein [Scytonema sp. PCC 10023]|uniref:hypothetical protein n=1 Tax=Scytonema sp. PCC 10023 TaxID=1680591 RepID=UPI0039C6BC95